MSTSTDRDLSRAIREWSEIVWADHVVTDRYITRRRRALPPSPHRLASR